MPDGRFVLLVILVLAVGVFLGGVLDLVVPMDGPSVLYPTPWACLTTPLLALIAYLLVRRRGRAS